LLTAVGGAGVWLGLAQWPEIVAIEVLGQFSLERAICGTVR
jgi:hypothetical protein